MTRMIKALLLSLILFTSVQGSMLVNSYWYAATGFNPISDVTSATCEAWWDASDASTITESSGLISGWADKTSNNHDWSQTNTPDKPTYSTSYLNGLNAVFFNNDSEYMTLSTALNIAQPATIFIVAEANVGAGQDSYIFYFNSNNIIWFSQYSFRFAIAYGSQGLKNNTYDSDPILTRFYLNGASTEIRSRLNSTGTVNAGTNNLQINSLGYQYNNQHQWVMEMIIYNGTLSAGDIASVELYLKNKWGGLGITWHDGLSAEKFLCIIGDGFKVGG